MEKYYPCIFLLFLGVTMVSNSRKSNGRLADVRTKRSLCRCSEVYFALRMQILQLLMSEVSNWTVALFALDASIAPFEFKYDLNSCIA